MLKQITRTFLILATLGIATAQAQPQREAVRDRIREVKAWQVVEDLGLDEDQAREFVPLMERYDRENDALKAERRRLEAELEELVKDVDANANPMRAVMADLRDLDRRKADNERWFRDQAYPLLSLQQQARYELFEKRFRAQIRELIKDVRRERGSRR